MKVVFATETLALGINMPARTVVLEKLEKFNGEARVAITSGEYTQLTGRAGRRGIDVEGHAVVQWTEGLDPQQVAALASRRTYPLNSSFRPTYNMAVNLIDQFGRARAREILESSFAQFQADRAVVGLARQVREQEESLAGYAKAMTCDRGDFTEYSGHPSRAQRPREAEPQGRERLARRPATRRQQQIASLRTRMQRHPCHQCPDREQHARWAERYWKLKRTVDKMRRQIEKRTGTVARIFDRVVDVLRGARLRRASTTTGATTLTPAGRTMRRIYGERDLLVARVAAPRTLEGPGCRVPRRARLLPGLRAAARRGRAGRAGLPRGPFRIALTETQELWQRLDDLEQDHHLPGSEPIATGLAQAMHSWARGVPLDRVLDRGRHGRRRLRALGEADDRPARPALDRRRRPRSPTTARKALDAVRRGIVAYSSV